MIGMEARALKNLGQGGQLALWAPDSEFSNSVSPRCRSDASCRCCCSVNLFRDPRWGRGQEVPGECPLLTSVFIQRWASGLQSGDDPRYLQAIASPKHFLACEPHRRPSRLPSPASQLLLSG